MGFYYTNLLYYGRLLSKKTKDSIQTKIPILKINDDRYILYTKKENIDDGVENIRLIPDLFYSEKLLALNEILTQEFFTNIDKTEFDKINVEPNFYICCFNSSSLDNFEYSKVLYNIKVV
jgi:hypothetical protein